MSIPLTMVLSCGDGSVTLSGSKELDCGVAPQIEYADDNAIPDGTSNMLVNVGWARASLKALYIICDQIVTIKSNSTGSPDDTVTTVPGVPIPWFTNFYATKPFNTADVVKLYISNASGLPANFRAFIGV